MSAALALGLAQLTPRERALFDALLDRGWVDTRDLRRDLYAGICHPNALRALVRYTRDRLHGTGWSIESARGTGAYRLVHADAALGAA